MAGTRKRLKFVQVICLLVLCSSKNYVACVGCLSQSNDPIDWFIAYKLPGKEKSLRTNSFFYMDAKSPEWVLSQQTLNESNQAISYTLQQIYQTSLKNVSSVDSELLFLMYNDEIPESTSNLRSDENGHTKGVIAFDRQSGFWLIHSTPKFPPPRSHSYDWPDSANIYGQSFLCISMDTSQNIEEIGRQLLYNYPDIYDKNLPEYFKKFKDMTAAINGKHVTVEPWYRETKLTSMGGVEFLSFAKYSKFNNDLYSDLLAPRFRSTLLVETWQNGRNKMCSNCTGVYKVFNIETVEFKQHGINFKETQDHSKWAVTNTTASIWTCIGDINRQMSQMKRPGGTVCLQNKSVWMSFHSLISTYHDCEPYKKCISP